MLIGIILCIVLILLYLKFKNYVPILMYHRIADVPGDRNSLPEEKFEQQLKYLADNHYTAITADMLYEHYTKGKPLPKKSVMLTFDDGYHDNYTKALPLLQNGGTHLLPVNIQVVVLSFRVSGIFMYPDANIIVFLLL